ncbi:MAG: response regulator of the LytR/AlgR family [Caulobacter sp.]|nr:response regulator of the LytR/AlgR family [Caulobacter sp.]
MSSLDLSPTPLPRALRPPAWIKAAAIGFLYWLAFLLLLEPGNLLRDGGPGLRWDQEVLRILVAACMGASVTPLLLALARRYPIERARLLRHGAVQALAIGVLAAALIVASCFPAAWLLAAKPLPSVRAIGDQLSGNWALLVYCMATFMAAAHAIRFYRQGQGPAPARPDAGQIAVTSRGRVTLIEIDAVDWIESQGNYLALHVGRATHLVRDTLARFEARLDPAAFVRIHRGAVIRLDRARALRPLANGDALVTLADGQEVRCSRSHRRALAGRLVA